MKERHKQIIELYQSGLTYIQIKKELGCSVGTVSTVLKKYSIPKRDLLTELRKAVEDGRTGKQIPKNHDINNYKFLIEMNHQDKMNLIDIAKKYKISKKAISRRFREFGIEVKVHRDKSIKATKSRIKEIPELNDREWLEKNYSEFKRTMQSIAKQFNVSYTYVRNRLIKNGIKIRKTNKFNNDIKTRTSRGKAVRYKAIKSSEITLRSFLECKYAIYLDNNDEVDKWLYEKSIITYFDGYIGKQRKYFIDFTIYYKNGKIENIEVKPKNERIISDKYLYAQNCVQNWRFISDDEFNAIEEFWINVNSNRVKFYNRPGNRDKYDFWFPSDDKISSEWTIIGEKTNNWIIIKRCVRNKSGKNKFKSRNKKFELSDKEFDELLQLIKNNWQLKDIANKYKVNYKTITALLRRKSYYVRWNQWKKKDGYNKLYRASKLI